MPREKPTAAPGANGRSRRPPPGTATSGTAPAGNVRHPANRGSRRLPRRRCKWRPAPYPPPIACNSQASRLISDREEMTLRPKEPHHPRGRRTATVLSTAFLGIFLVWKTAKSVVEPEALTSFLESTLGILIISLTTTLLSYDLYVELKRVGDHKDFKRALDFYDLLALLLPKRLRNEDQGDYLEVINKLQRDGAAKWKIYLKMITTSVFLFANAVHELASRLKGLRRS